MSATLKGTAKSLNTPEEHVAKGGVEIEVVHLGDMKVKRATYPAGWRFSKDMGAPRCYDTHVGYAISGHIVAELENGERVEARPGSAFVIPAGHDAWVVGNEPAVIVQFDEGDSAIKRFNVEKFAKAA